jgi:hypothetical protein
MSVSISLPLSHPQGTKRRLPGFARQQSDGSLDWWAPSNRFGYDAGDRRRGEEHFHDFISWLKKGGPSKLLERIDALGNVVCSMKKIGAMEKGFLEAMDAAGAKGIESPRGRELATWVVNNPVLEEKDGKYKFRTRTTALAIVAAIIGSADGR